MSKGYPYVKQKARKAAHTVSGAMIGALAFGLAATGTASANNNYNYGGYGGRGSHGSGYNNYQNGYSNQHRYTQYRWVYDRYLDRWVLVGFNYNTSRWERCDHDSYSNHDRYSNSGNYWYGSHDEYSD